MATVLLILFLCNYYLFVGIPHDTHSKVAAETKKNVGTFHDRAGPSGHSRSPRQISSFSAELWVHDVFDLHM